MSSQSPIVRKSIDELSPEEKGQLLASIGVRRSGRPFDPITVAEIFKYTPSNGELAKKLGVSSRLVGMFKSLLFLPEDIKDYVRVGKISSIDKAVRIASLRDPIAQLFLAKAIVTEPTTFTAPVISAIVTLKNRNKDMPIEDCTKRVLKSRPIIENRYVFVTSIAKDLSKTVTDKAQAQGISAVELLKGILRQSLPSDESLLSAVIHDGSILLTLTVDGWQALRQKTGSLGVPLDELVETLVRLSFETGTSQ